MAVSRAYLLELLRVSLGVLSYTLNAHLQTFEGPSVRVSRNGWKDDVQKGI